MSPSSFPRDELSILARLDVSSPESLQQSIALEFWRLHEENLILRAQLEELSSISAISDRIANAARGDSMCTCPDQILIEAEHSLDRAVGLQALQYDSKNQPFRWTGPTPRFSFELFIDRNFKCIFELVFDGVSESKPVNDLRCYVDSMLVTLDIQKRDDVHFARGRLHPRYVRGATVISFVCPQFVSLSKSDRLEESMAGFRFRGLWARQDVE